MDAMKFFEELAKSVHYRVLMDGLLEQQSEKVRRAFLESEGAKVKMEVSKEKWFADAIRVVLDA